MRLRFILGLVVSAIFVFLAFRKVNYHEMLATLKSAEYIWLVPAIAFMFVSHWLRAVRWRYFIEPIKAVKTVPLFSAVMIGYAANNLFPLRIGEFLRAYAVGKSQQISKSSAFATVIVERLVDVLSLLILLAGTILISPLPQIIRKSGYVIFIVTIAVILLLVFLMENTERTVNLLRLFLPDQIFNFVQKIVRSFLKGFMVFKKTEHYLIIIVLSILVWSLYAATVYVSFYAFDFQSNFNLDVISSFVVLVTISIGIMIPSSPGFVGTYHWFAIMGLAFCGVPKSEASSYALISHAMNVVPITFVGLIFFWRENLHFSDAVIEKEKIEHEIEEEQMSDATNSQS
ncbi:MAG: lysylphosphatidylglycerol synthase transmembrane domain-containing protein [bacterium]